jgi:anti-sigma regulatory factor (Ser/Thr protein kinase)
MLSVALRNQASELLRLSSLVERFGEDHQLSGDDVMKVNLVLDEIVANVIRHGKAGENETQVSLALDGRRLIIDVTDAGVAFNPLDAPPPIFDVPLEERRPGGLGIHIVKTLAESVSYSRDSDRNHLKVTMRLENAV